MNNILKKDVYRDSCVWRIFGVPIFSYRRKSAKCLVDGENNKVVNLPRKCELRLYGDGNQVIFAEDSQGFRGSIQVGALDCRVSGCRVEIGHKVLANGVAMTLMEDGTTVSIGDSCIISSEVVLWASDTHSIFDADGNLCNRGQYIRVGNDVWLGYRSVVLKNVSIAPGCIVGACAVVTRSVDCLGSVVAGNPARVVASDVKWDASRPNGYIDKVIVP